ncbi:preprotein translocase subunit SecY [Defluviitalea raffinosedens]|uniref:Protein translocase subunit SecY n=1 Tax=Defluviitalea raffinosedens TaxID=1450156 RepID=A0A7C8HFY1_9FIRM|nr:preprotein translocase subunit SecY [Defluviitalea raffinosedens]KAE9635536.1 preprotein translocase subunit SecY [Defluviitalea raffinosedens]HHW68444.1 preprotein translocase subunit SecY [Candidatus Epulonipiscium sp.]
MFKTLRNAWKIPDLRKRLIYTFMMLLVIRLGAHIPVPGVNASAIKNLLKQQGGALGLFDMISGGALQNMTIFAMGIVPYINASIILQLLQIAIPKLEEMAKEGEEGRKTIAKYTRYLTIVLAAIQAWGFTFAMRNQNVLINPNLWSWIVAILSFVAGTAFMMWIGEQITEKGIGNGTSLIIFVNIVSRLPVGVNVLLSYKNYVVTALLLVVFVIMIAFVVLVQQGERRIAVQYAKRTSGRKVYGGQSTHIPVKVNLAGVIPIIFAMSLLQFPEMVTNFFVANPTGVWGKILVWLRWTHPFGAVLYALLILFFTFFYSTITFNPIEIANNMKKNGGFIPGIRPGKPTADYLTKVVNQITLVGAIFLAIIALMPVALQAIFKMNVSFGGTSLLIVVGVALDTVKQMEAQMLMRHYKGFLS